MAAHSVKQFARLHPITGRSKTRIPAPPCGCDQPFLPNQRQNCVHHPQPDASHSLPMCGMNTLRAPSGFFCRSAGETLQASKAITRLAAIGGTLCRPTPVPFVDCPARCWLGPKQPWRNRLLRPLMPNQSSVSWRTPPVLTSILTQKLSVRHVSNLIIRGIKVGQSPIIERQGRGVPQDRLHFSRPPMDNFSQTPQKLSTDLQSAFAQ